MIKILSLVDTYDGRGIMKRINFVVRKIKITIKRMQKIYTRVRERL